MATNTHIERWISRAEMDYYTMFIKTWIPFNSWYMRDFYDETCSPKRTSDREIIDHLIGNDNKYKSKIQNLLKATDEQGQEFKRLISKLHFELVDHTIPNEEERVSFYNTSLSKNALKKYSSPPLGQFIYFAEFKDQLPKTQKRWICEIQKKTNNQTVQGVELFNWSLDELNNHPDFLSVSDINDRNQLRQAFMQINPMKPTEIILPPKRSRSNKIVAPSNSMVIDESKNLYFVDDHDLVSKIIIQLIYELRCKLFHGELDPSEANMGVYENAFKIQRMLIKELK
jgi:hypothetical protein